MLLLTVAEASLVTVLPSVLMISLYKFPVPAISIFVAVGVLICNVFEFAV